MLRPKKVKAGDPILAEKINELIDAIMERTPLSFFNGFLTPLPHGFHVRTKGGGSSGSLAGLQSLQLVNTSTEDTRKIRVVAGSIAGEMPAGMSPGDDPICELTGIPGSGYVLAKITYTTSTGVITAREIIQQAEAPEETDGVVYVLIGSWSIDEDDVMHLSNARYGPIDLMICRDWYASPAHYSVNLV